MKAASCWPVRFSTGPSSTLSALGASGSTALQPASVATTSSRVTFFILRHPFPEHTEEQPAVEAHDHHRHGPGAGGQHPAVDELTHLGFLAGEEHQRHHRERKLEAQDH